VNYLAHIHLAGPDPEAQIGALLGDFVKPAGADTFPPVMQREIRLHRAIDAFTDSHPVVLAAKGLFRKETRRYSGIVLDVYYDHVLAREWSAWSDEPLMRFTHRFYAALSAVRGTLPERLERLTPYLVAEDWLGSYARFDGVDRAIRRLSTRLSRGAEGMVGGLQDLRAHDAEFAAGFAVFYPALMAHVRSERELLVASTDR
jgi:acyl carrier protein phosphodiesterase